MAYGNDYTSVQAASLAEQGMVRSGIENALNRFMGMLNQRQRISEANRDFSFRAENAAKNLALNQQQLDMQKAAYAEQSLRAASALDFAKTKHDDELRFAFKELQERAKNSPDDRKRQNDLNNMLGIAGFGRAPDSKRLREFNFSEPEIEVITRTNEAAKDLQRQSYKAATGIVGLQKTIKKLETDIADKRSKNTGMFGWQKSDSKEILELTNKKVELEKHLDLQLKRKDAGQLVAPDPDTGMLTPLVPPPYEEPGPFVDTESQDVSGGSVPGLPESGAEGSGEGFTVPGAPTRRFGFGGPFTGGDFTPAQEAVPTRPSTRVLRYNPATGELE